MATTTPSGLVAPLVHLGGTGRTELERQFEVATGALANAITAVEDTAPNGRDYVLGASSLALNAAESQHRARLRLLQTVLEELNELHIAIVDQP